MIVTAAPYQPLVPAGRPAEAARPGEPPRSEPVDQVADLASSPVPGSRSLARTALATAASMAGATLRGPVPMTAAMWGGAILDASRLGALSDVGAIVPRTGEGLLGLVTAPFLHKGLEHLTSNSLGVMVAGTMVAIQGPRKFRDVTLISAATSGLGYWLTGPGPAIGASGIVYGYIGYAMTRGFFEHKPLPIAMTAASILLLGGSLAGLLPGTPGVAWQGHLFGFMGGVAAAALLPKDAPRT